MRMLSVWGEIWPMAVAGALSPTITVIVLAILMQPDKPRTRAMAFLLGAVLSMLIWALLVSSAVWGLVTATERDIERYGRGIDLVVGVLLFAFGFWRLVRSPDPRTKSKPYLANLSDGPLRYQVAFGAIMQGRNVTSVLLFCAAQQHIDIAPLAMWQALTLTAVTIAIMVSSIWLPMLLPIRATDTLHSRLNPAKEWLSDHAKLIEVGAAFVGSAYLLYRAIA